MPTTASVDNWQVVVSFGDNSQTRIYVVPVATTVLEIKEQYGRDVGVDVDAITFDTVTGQCAGDSQCLQDVGELVEFSKLIKFIIPATDVEIQSSIGHQSRSYVLPSSTTIRRLRERYSRDIGVDHSVFLLKLDGVRVRGSQQLKDIAAVETGVRRKIVFVASKPSLSDFGAQETFDDQVTTPRQFRIGNGTKFNDGEDFSCDLLLADPVTVGAVRAAVAAKVRLTAGELCLGRYVGRSKGGDVCVRVCDEEGRDSIFGDFSDVAGGIHKWEDVQNERLCDLDDDDAVFPLSPNRRNILFVYTRHYE